MKSALILSDTIREINRTADKRKSDLNLVALDSYFEGTGYRPDRADHFALAAPFGAAGANGLGDENNDVVFDFQCVAVAGAGAQSAAGAFFC